MLSSAPISGQNIFGLACVDIAGTSSSLRPRSADSDFIDYAILATGYRGSPLVIWRVAVAPYDAAIGYRNGVVGHDI